MSQVAEDQISPRVELIDEFLKVADTIILGKQDQIKLAMCTILAEGHLLIEDVPGVGKTTLVRLFGRGLGLQTSRIQFTNDLLPSDILGTSIFDVNNQSFRFHRGPIFGQLVIADELNRATPKTQGACLQAMEERQVTVDGATYPLPDPFIVIATQNPKDQSGTYPLPESQLDRFLMRIHLGYPDQEAERSLLKGKRRALLIDELKPIINPDEITKMQKASDQVFVADAMVDYVQRILQYSRNQSENQWGLSPRAGISMLRAAKAWAYMEGRSMVLPEDVQEVAPHIIAHRLNGQVGDSFAERQWADQAIQSVPVD